MRTMILAGAALLAASPGAHAALLNGVKAAALHVGQVASADLASAGSRAAYAIRLQGGRDYAVGAESASGCSPCGFVGVILDVYDPGGRKVLERQVEDETAVGGALRPRADGTWTVVLRNTAPDDSRTFVQVRHDCRDGPGTACAILPGPTTGGSVTFAGNADAWRIQAPPGSYVATAAPGNRDPGRFAPSLAVVDARGRALASGDQALAFTLPPGGPWFLRAADQNGEAGYGYSVTLKAGR